MISRAGWTSPSSGGRNATCVSRKIPCSMSWTSLWRYWKPARSGWMMPGVTTWTHTTRPRGKGFPGFACDEVAELLDRTGRSKEDKERLNQIENMLATLARLGRAFGIHLILATQRPDATLHHRGRNCVPRLFVRQEAALTGGFHATQKETQ